MVNSRTFTRYLDGEFLIGESNDSMSREQSLVIPLTTRLQPGTVLGKITEGAVTVAGAPVAGNTGNGTMSTPTLDPATNAGVYRVLFSSPTVFQVLDPRGVIVGRGAPGAAFTGPVIFTITNGGTAFAAGDGFTITVTIAAANQWGPLDLTKNNGQEIAKGFNFYGLPINTGTTRTAIIARDARVNGKKIFWPAGITDLQKSTASGQLANRETTGSYGNIQIGY